MTNETSVTPFSATIANLTTCLLEREPSRYLEVLEHLSKDQDPEHKRGLKEKLNEKPYNTWYSNHVFSLSRLVGKMNQGAIDEGYEVGDYYGSRNKEGISQDLGISLLKMIVNAGGDILAKDYYDNSIIDYLSHPECSKFSRTDNEEFMRVVEGIYYAGVEEGIPPEH